LQRQMLCLLLLALTIATVAKQEEGKGMVV
jgi:hypothetical protein